MRPNDEASAGKLRRIPWTCGAPNPPAPKPPPPNADATTEHQCQFTISSHKAWVSKKGNARVAEPNAAEPPNPPVGAGVAAGVLDPNVKLPAGLAGVDENSEPAPVEVDGAAPNEGVPNALVCWGADAPKALAATTQRSQ